MSSKRKKEVEDPNNTWNMQLVAALLAHDVDTAAALLDKGADVNHYAGETNSSASLLCTPLHHVILRGGCDEKVLLWLATHNASGELRVNKVSPIFHHLVQTENTETLEKLCALAAKHRDLASPLALVLNMDAVDANNVTACVLSLHLHRPDLAKILLSHGCLAPFSQLVTAKYTALARACVMGDVQSAETLLSSGDIPTQQCGGQTLLHVSLHQPAIVDLLLDRGASIHALNADGETPLLYVIKHRPNAHELFDFLLMKGADVNMGDHLGVTPLMHVIIAHNPELIKRLLTNPDLKVDINAKDHFGSTALHWAITTRQRCVLEMLLATEGIDINAVDGNGASALHRAATRGKLDALTFLLLQPTIDVNIADKHGNTALHCAVMKKESECVAALLKRCSEDFLVVNGAAPANAKDAKKPAVKKGQSSTADIVPGGINPRLEVDAVNREGRTALQLAITVLRDTEMAAQLLSAGASVDREGEKGGTLLHSAVWGESFEMTETLLNSGADATLRDDDDEAPLHIAARKGNAAIAKLLLMHHALVDDQSSCHLRAPLHYACERGDETMIRLLIDARASPSLTDRLARSPLHLLCLYAAAPRENEQESEFLARRQSAASAASLLLARDAPIDASDTCGWLPIHAACAADLDSIVQLLVDSGSPLTYADTRGWTPIHVAVAHGSCRSLKVLLHAIGTRGMSLDVELSRVDTLDRFPMMLAAELGQKEAARMLIALRK